MPLIIAVDLGAHAVKVTTYRSTGRRVELEDRFSTLVPQNGAPPTREARLVALEALLDENPGWRGATVGLVMQGEECSFRPMKMPFTDRAQVEKTLPFAIEGEVPYDLDDMVLGWRTSKLEDGSRIMAILSREDAMLGDIEALKERGIDPKNIVPDGELLGEYAPLGTTALIDIGHTHTTVSVAVDGVVRASRAVNVGGWNFTRAIQVALECEWGHAEALKHGRVVDVDATEGGGERRSGYASLPPPARQAVDGAVGQMLAEIRSTLIRFEDEHDLDIEQVRLSGGGARIPEIQGYIARDLGLEVRFIEDPDGESVPLEYGASHAMARVTAGLSSEPRVEMRAGDYAFTGGVNTLRAVLLYSMAGGAFFALTAVAIFAFQYVSLMGQIAETNGRIAKTVHETFPEIPEDQVPTGNEAVAIMTEFTRDTVARSEMLPPSQKGKPMTVDTLYSLVAALPAHTEVPVQLKSLEVLPELVIFEGETDSFAQSASIEQALQGNDTFKRANKDSENKRGAKVSFKFSIPLGEEPEAEEG